MATNNFKRKFSTNIGTTATAVGGYSVLLDVQTTAIGLALANVTASQVTVSVTLNTQAGDTIHIIKDAPIPTGGSLELIDGGSKVVLQSGDAVKAFASAASSVDIITSVVDTISA